MTSVFIAVFSVFVASTLVLIVLTMRWAIRSDRNRRQGPPDTTT